MMTPRTSIVALALVGCGGGVEPMSVPDATEEAPDAPQPPGPDAMAVGLPTWMLEDVQPQSPRFGQTYGLEAFSGSHVVVTLVEGF
jgi:hypothetical protein